MARSVEEILRSQLGQMFLELAILTAQKEQLEERMAELQRKPDGESNA